MSWLVLVVSGVLEAVWATALGRAAGFTRLWPSVIFVVRALFQSSIFTPACGALPLAASLVLAVLVTRIAPGWRGLTKVRLTVPLGVSWSRVKA